MSNDTACIRCPSRHLHRSPEGSSTQQDCTCDQDKLIFQIEPSVEEWKEGSCGCNRSTVYSSAEDKCIPCPDGVSSKAGPEQLCDVCEEGFFRFKGTDEASKANCKSCFEGVICPWNSTLQNVTMAAGWWRVDTRAYEVKQCPESAPNTTMCTPGGVVGNCSAGDSGPLCQVCDVDGTYYKEGLCLQCPSKSHRFSLFAGIVLPFVVLVSALLWFFSIPPTKLKNRRLRTISKRTRHTVRFLKTAVHATGLQAKIKIVLSFYQVATSLDTYRDGTRTRALPD